MLAQSAGALFFFLSVREWTLLQAVSFSFVVLCAIELLNWGVFGLFENTTERKRKRIPPGGQALFDRTFKDYAFIVINKCTTVMFAYHLAHYIYYSETMPKQLAQLSFWNTLPAFIALFVVYDFTYSLFHRFLHVRSVYGYIHKHHHRQASPIQGHDDAVNTHPFEFVCGEYNHLFAIAVVPCHMYTAIAFVAVGGVLASLSHTRFDITVKLGKIMFYSVKEHDTHHRLLTGNYGQYTQVWDRIFGTFYEWTEPRELNNASAAPQVVGPANTTVRMTLSGGGPNRPAPFAPPMCKPKATQDTRESALRAQDAPAVCAVTQAASPLGQALIKQLVARGAKRIVAIDLAFPSNSAAVAKAAATSNLSFDDIKKVFEQELHTERARVKKTLDEHAVIVEPIAQQGKEQSASQDPADDVFALPGVEAVALDISDKSSKAQVALEAALAGVDTVYHLLPKYIYDLGLATGTFNEKVIVIDDKLTGRQYEPIKLPTTGVVSEEAKAVHALSRSAKAAKEHARTNHPARRFANATSHIVAAAKQNKVSSIVFASSTSARIPTNADVECMDESGLLQLSGKLKGNSLEDLEAAAKPTYSMAVRAAENLIRKSNTPGVLHTCVVAAAGGLYSAEAECPNGLTKSLDAHVRAPAATSFVGALASTSRLFNDRIPCGGANMASFTHVDNLAHSLILASAQLKSSSKPGKQPTSEEGEYYIVSDGDAQYLWDLMEKARLALGLGSIWARYHIYLHVLKPLTLIATFLAKVPVVQHLVKGWPTLATLDSLTSHRYFTINKAITQLGYKPVRSFEVEFPAALQAAQRRWFQATGIIPPQSTLQIKAKSD